MRLPYCYISDVKEENYSIRVDTELGERLIFKGLGEKREFLRRSLTESMSLLSMRTQRIIGEIQPQLDTMIRRKLADLMKDGRAAGKTEFDKLS